MNSSFYDSRKARLMLTVSRIVVYAILIFLSILCLFAFWLLFVNASRSHSDLQGGFQLLPDRYFLTNLVNAWNDASIDIPRGMLNSFLIASSTALLTTYFSTLTAYGIHAYNFKLRISPLPLSWQSWSYRLRSPLLAFIRCALNRVGPTAIFR